MDNTTDAKRFWDAVDRIVRSIPAWVYIRPKTITEVRAARSEDV